MQHHSFQRCKRRPIIILFLLVLSLCSPKIVTGKESAKVAAKQPTTGGTLAQEDGMDEECKPVGQCEVCFSRDRSKKECTATGKRQRFECVVTLDNGKDETSTVFRSCKRTVADEEFLMVQMQVFCFLLGGLAVLSVRKQKLVSLSLFDQRRIQSGKRRTSSETGSLTLELAKQQGEITPLTHESSIDVV